MKKEEEDNGFLRAAGLTIKNGSNPSIYKGLRKKVNKKERKRGGGFWKYIYMNCRWQQDSYYYE